MFKPKKGPAGADPRCQSRRRRGLFRGDGDRQNVHRESDGRTSSKSGVGVVQGECALGQARVREGELQVGPATVRAERIEHAGRDGLRAGGGGVILNIGSTAGIRPRPGLTWYNGSKGAVNLLSKSMAVELAPDRIRVNCIAPVIGNTALLESFMGVPDTPENRAKFIATIPLGRLSEPLDVARAAVFLASDDAAFITGVELPVDGGRTV